MYDEYAECTVDIAQRNLTLIRIKTSPDPTRFKMGSFYSFKNVSQEDKILKSESVSKKKPLNDFDVYLHVNGSLLQLSNFNALT